MKFDGRRLRQRQFRHNPVTPENLQNFPRSGDRKCRSDEREDVSARLCRGTFSIHASVLDETLGVIAGLLFTAIKRRAT